MRTADASPFPGGESSASVCASDRTKVLCCISAPTHELCTELANSGVLLVGSRLAVKEKVTAHNGELAIVDTHLPGGALCAVGR